MLPSGGIFQDEEPEEILWQDFQTWGFELTRQNQFRVKNSLDSDFVSILKERIVNIYK